MDVRGRSLLSGCRDEAQVARPGQAIYSQNRDGYGVQGGDGRKPKRGINSIEVA